MKFLVFIFSFSMLVFSPATLQESPSSYLIIWNVGQGAWSTYIHGEDCWHFDAGGEHFPKAVEKLCRGKQNRVFISHDDMDHISYISRVNSWPRVCLFQLPRKISSPRKQQIFDRLQLCERTSETSRVRELVGSGLGKNSNDLSRVYYLPQAQALFPGDSSSKEEKFWSQRIDGQKVRWWLLGHHGSQSSSSEFLIHALGHPAGAISSARYQKYRHPHPLVRARLRQKSIPLLRTEEWGDLWIRL